jgi:lipopolysaccharide/colanic/teichoic acid biosynthesis glycosyltransferase
VQTKTETHEVHELAISPLWQNPTLRSCKRMIDFVFSALLLVLSTPLFVFLAILVKLTSCGPVFYRWRVVGEGGRPITSYKFRSMYRDADQRKAALLARNEMTGPVFKMTNDPRITPLGRVLRKYSLDELPQLWSVLKGDMSLVGPRPPLLTEWEHFTERQKQKVQVKPGVTCLWQINGRNQISDFDDWVQLDLQYIQEWSLGLDLKILLKTIPAVILGKGK